MDKIISGWSRPNKGVLTTIVTGLSPLRLSVTAQTTRTAIAETWLYQEKAAKIELSQQRDEFFGKTVWLKEPHENRKATTDNKNPDKTRYNDPIIGWVMLKHFVCDRQSTGEGGTIYEARNGKTYSCYRTLQAHKSLEVRGYGGISLFGQEPTNLQTEKR